MVKQIQLEQEENQTRQDYAQVNHFITIYISFFLSILLGS
jgi:hypothetical protein